MTLDNIIDNLKNENYLSALLMALKLNEEEVIDKVFKCIPIKSISLICANFPSNYLYRFLEFIQKEIEMAKDIEWNMIWLKELLKYNEHVLKGCRLFQEYHQRGMSMSQLQQYQLTNNGQNLKGRAVLLKLFSSLNFFDSSLKKIVNENLHMMTYMERAAKKKQEDEDDEGMVTNDTAKD